MSKVKIAKPEDQKMIQAILYELRSSLFDQSITDKHLNRLAEKYASYGIVLTAQDKDVLFGCIALYCNDFENLVAFISMIVVKTEFQKEGIGYQLINAAEHIARKKGMRFICLEVSKENLNAIHFYKKYAYCIAAKKQGTYLMTKELV